MDQASAEEDAGALPGVERRDAPAVGTQVSRAGWVLMPGFTCSAPVTCPECGAGFEGTWTGQDFEPDPQVVPQDQECPQGHVFPATWPGWSLEPRVVIVRRDGPRR